MLILAGCLPARYCRFMPGKHLFRMDGPNTYYHVFNRGVNKQLIFNDKQDYAVFLSLIKRYLGDKPAEDLYGREYPWMTGKLELLAFCLMPNHFHLLIQQIEQGSATQLLKVLCTSYAMYFNKRYMRTGSLFENHFRAVTVDTDEYLMHVSRYIHLNPKNFQSWQWSSYPYYKKKSIASWLKPDMILEMVGSTVKYQKFVVDHKDYSDSLKIIKRVLADK